MSKNQGLLTEFDEEVRQATAESITIHNNYSYLVWVFYAKPVNNREDP